MRIKVLVGVLFLVSAGLIAQEEGDEPYLSIEDQEAILDKAADEIMEASIKAQHRLDAAPAAKPGAEKPAAPNPPSSPAAQKPVAPPPKPASPDAARKPVVPSVSQPAKAPYAVRIEIYARTIGKKTTEYIGVGDLSLESGFFSWTHDGRKRNGYAVFMYPVTRNASRINPPSGVRLLYGKSFRSAQEAITEIQKRGSDFNKLIRYKPVVNQMIERLRNAPYHGGSL